MKNSRLKPLKRKSKLLTVLPKGRNVYEEEVNQLKSQVTHWNNFFVDENEPYRRKEWQQLDSNVESLCQRFAWAIPDERALRILERFSPLIEIGAGKGYWAKLLRDRGVDIVAFDKFVFNESSRSNACTSCFTEVMEGGPEKLQLPSMSHRNLFLCYPDESESMSIAALEIFSQEYLIHVGEMIHSGTCAGAPVAPFGRTSSAEFQVALTESFHCLLICQLQTTYPNSKDCISVWKRTRFVPGEHG
jgi:hypothetical protein